MSLLQPPACRLGSALLLLLLAACYDEPTTGPGREAPARGPSLGVTGANVIDIGRLGEYPTALADLNDARQITGTSQAATCCTGAFFWSQATGMQPRTLYDVGEGRALNELGTVVGWSDSPSGNTQAFIFPLGGPGQYIAPSPSVATDVNDLDHVTGQSGSQAFLWTSAGGLQLLGVLPGAGSSGGLRINASDQVLGSSDQRAFLWSTGTGMVDLGNLGGIVTVPRDLNDAGQAVGYSALFGSAPYHAFRWTAAGGIEDLGTLGGDFSQAEAINASGQVVGWARRADGRDHAFLWTPGVGMRDLGALGGITSRAMDINDAGDVTGWWRTSGGQERAFIWTAAGEMQDLGVPFGGTESVGLFINDDREVAGEVGGIQPPGESPGAHTVLWYNIVTQNAPVAEAGGPYTGRAGDPIAFDGSGSSDPEGDPLTYGWDFDDDGTVDSTGAQVEYAFQFPGTYPVRLYVTDDANATRADSATVTVTPRRWPVAVIDVPQGGYTGAEASRILLRSDGSESQDGGPLLYRWEFGDGTAAASRFQATPFQWYKRYGDDGAYTVRLIVTDVIGRSDTATAVVQVTNTAPYSRLALPRVVRENSPFPMVLWWPSDSSWVDRQAGFTYAFDCGTGSGFGAWQDSVRTTCQSRVDQQTYDVRARVRDKDGGIRQYTYALTTVNHRPIITGLSWNAGVLTIGFTDPGLNDAPWHWVVDWGDGIRSHGLVSQQGAAVVQTPHAYAGSGPYTVTVYVVDKDRGPASSFETLSVTP